MDLLIFGVKTLLLAVPLYVTNGCALLFKGKTQLDLNNKFFDNRPLFGKGKTIKGTIGGFACGTIASALVFLGLPEASQIFNANFLLLGFLLSLGAVIGDIIASFIKRRLGLAPGAKAFLLDQLDFIIIGLVFATAVYIPSIIEIVLLAVLTPLFHAIGNWIAFKAKRKNVAW